MSEIFGNVTATTMKPKSIIKQNLSGNIIAAKDVSPIEHELKITANLFKVDKVTEQDTDNGKVVVNDDGTLTIANKTQNYLIFGKLTTLCPSLKGGETITFSYQCDNQNCYLGLKYYPDIAFGNNLGSFADANNPSTVTLPEDISNVYMWFSADFDPHTVSNIIVVKGESINFADVTVSRYGKNLCDNVFEKGEINSSTGVNQVDTSTTSVRTKNFIPILPNTVYTMTNPIANAAQKTRFYDKDKNYIGYSMGTPNFISKDENNLVITATTPENAYFMRFQLDFWGSTITATEVREGKHLYQLELGSQGTKFEPCNIQTETANADGTVRGLASVSPSMTLVPNNPNVILECEYNADTKLYIDNKIAELVSGVSAASASMEV